MKTLHIIRHAKSSWMDAGISDHDRPLNKRGKRDAPFMAELFSKRHSADQIISSTALRARSTAIEFAKVLEIAETDIVLNAYLYHAGVRELLDVINSVDDEMNELLIFGHNPGLSYLVEYLDNSHPINLVTCARVTMSFETDSWSEVSADTGSVLSNDFPKNHL